MLPCLTILYLAAKSSHVDADVDVLVCSLHHPTTYNHQRGGQCCLIGAGPFQGVRSPRVWIFNVVLIVRVPLRPNLTW
jgi:hypothetical protein